MDDFQLTDYMQYALALVFVLALIGVLAALAKRMGVGGAAPRRRGRDRRLSISEVLALDGKRKLMLVRRDSTEHLVIIGPNAETVVESGISPPSEDFAAAVRSAARREPPLRGDARPTTEIAGQALVRKPDPTTSPPVAQRRPGTTPGRDPETPA